MGFLDFLNKSKKIARGFTIVPWEPGYYPDIANANLSQQNCYSHIAKSIRNGEYIDVQGNEAYLHFFRYELNRMLTRGTSDSERKYANNLYRTVINLYENTNPKVTFYYYPWLVFSDLVSMRSHMLLQK